MIIVILCGGYGSRLWPASRSLDPKPFLRIQNNLSILQKTLLRVLSIKQIEAVLTVTNDELFFRICDEYEILFNPLCCDYSEKSYYQNVASAIKFDILLEPIAKNTAAAVINSCLFAEKYYSKYNGILFVPADHLILDENKFAQYINYAEQQIKLRSHQLITFGIIPSYPETGYGYIRLGDNLTSHIDDMQIYNASQFVEKPNFELAQKLVSSNMFLWNSGMFCGRIDAFLYELEKYQPNMLNIGRECLSHAFNNQKTTNNHFRHIVNLQTEYFKHFDNISIDYALLEKINNIIVIPCKFQWSDVGSWSSLYDNLKQLSNNKNDKSNNVLFGVEKCVNDNMTNCLVYSTNHNKLIATIDIDNLVIADMQDALLIANKSSSQKVKNIVERMQDADQNITKLHPKVYRPWGQYTVIEEISTTYYSYKVKRIEVKPHASLSLQMHHKRSEHWIVIYGIATVTIGDLTSELLVSQSTYIPIGMKHRLENKTSDNLIIIEVQCGDYLGEDDIVRFEDEYNRSC